MQNWSPLFVGSQKAFYVFFCFLNCNGALHDFDSEQNKKEIKLQEVVGKLWKEVVLY